MPSATAPSPLPDSIGQPWTLQPAAEPDAAAQQAPAASASAGPSMEMRRFSAGIRAIVALLCTLLLIEGESAVSPWAIAVLLAYDLWAGHVLWAEATARAVRRPLLLFWIDATWTVLTLHLTSAGTMMMMVVTLVQPVVLASIGFGVRQGVLLGLAAAAGMLADVVLDMANGSGIPRIDLVAAFAVLALAPLAALLSRPMSVLRQRLELVRAIEDKLDPRRGLDAMASALVDALREGLGADVVALLLPSTASAPAFISASGESAFQVGADMQRRIETLLQGTPDAPCSHILRRWWGLRGGSRVHGPGGLQSGAAGRLDELAALLEVQMLVVVPLRHYRQRHGHLVVGLRDARARMPEVAALADAAPELFRLVEQASLVDRLQEESSAHERVRIGRDLHDSAIQPYLGLKYAVEGVAQRVERDNPVRADIDALLDLVNGEVGALREIITGLRNGEAGAGDDALLPALRRQVRRFSLLFGIAVELRAPEQLRTSRALAGAIFHMVNEAMNNIRKHTPAHSVCIELQERDGEIELRVRDDGGTVQGGAQQDFQPRSLSERVAALGGRLHVQRGAGLDTELVIVVPALRAAPT